MPDRKSSKNTVSIHKCIFGPAKPEQDAATVQRFFHVPDHFFPTEASGGTAGMGSPAWLSPPTLGARGSRRGPDKVQQGHTRAFLDAERLSWEMETS